MKKAYINNATVDELQKILGRGRAKNGIFEGDLFEGELEIGQISSMINKMQSSKEIIDDIMQGFLLEKNRIQKLTF